MPTVSTHGHAGATEKFSPQGPVLSGMITAMLIKGRELVAKTFADRLLCKQPCSLFQCKNGYWCQSAGQASGALGIVLDQGSPQQGFTKLSVAAVRWAAL